MHVLNEMHRLLRDQIVLAMPLFCRATNLWEPGNREHPTILHDSLTSRLLLHRYLCELPEPICCHGIIFGYVAVAPYSFHRRGTYFIPPWRQMPRIMLMLTFS